jgi:phosphoribosylglycinamide formyltransferase-1
MSTPSLRSAERASRKQRLSTIAASLPEVTVEDRGDHIGFSVGKKRFAWLLDSHHGDGRLALNVKGERGENSALVQVHPERYHLPAYLAKQGWIGLWLDLRAVDWSEVRDLLERGWRLAAPKRLLRGDSSRE